MSLRFYIAQLNAHHILGERKFAVSFTDFHNFKFSMSYDVFMLSPQLHCISFSPESFIMLTYFENSSFIF